MVFVPKCLRKLRQHGSKVFRTHPGAGSREGLLSRTVAAMEHRSRLAQGDRSIEDKPIDFLYISFYYVPREA